MRLIIIFYLLSFIISCTVSVRNGNTPSGKSDVSKNTFDFPDNRPLPVIDQTVPQNIAVPVSQWTGKKVFVLPKQNLLQQNGYELFSCKFRDCNSQPYDKEWELKNHRIRCEKISGDTLTVLSVEPDSNEWIVTFIHSKSSKTIYGRTHQGALQEITPFDDLSSAQQRWLNKTVFSKKGVIATFGANSSNSISSFRVNILDSLIVTDVKWGITPLPVKPLWLMVTSRSTGKSGFIPVRFSWTNTLANQILEEQPWDDDIFESNPRSIIDCEENTWEVINNHRVILEMTKEQVKLSWGRPQSIQKDSSGTEMERWFYPSNECTFSNGVLTAISERTAK